MLYGTVLTVQPQKVTMDDARIPSPGEIKLDASLSGQEVSPRRVPTVISYSSRVTTLRAPGYGNILVAKFRYGRPSV